MLNYYDFFFYISFFKILNVHLLLVFVNTFFKNYN